MENKTFEELMKELETLVAGLEGGSIELDKALGMYKRGIGIIKELNKKLDDARKQVGAMDSIGETDE